jgi:hypothetical protein
MDDIKLSDLPPLPAICEFCVDELVGLDGFFRFIARTIKQAVP